MNPVQPKTTSGQRPALRSRTALIVEDDAAIRTTLTGLLEDDDFEVMTAATIERARYILFESRHPVGVMVLDLVMPDSDGEHLLAEMHEHDGKAVPTVLLSASAKRVGELAEKYGIPFMTKPFDLGRVAAAITVAFENDVRPHRRHTFP